MMQNNNFIYWLLSNSVSFIWFIEQDENTNIFDKLWVGFGAAAIMKLLSAEQLSEMPGVPSWKQPRL
jgi:hypothetical protein